MRWKEYCEHVKSENGNRADSVDQLQQLAHEPPALCYEVQQAVRDIASCTYTGPNQVPVELFKPGGDTIVDKINWPQDWIESVFTPL